MSLSRTFPSLSLSQVSQDLSYLDDDKFCGEEILVNVDEPFLPLPRDMLRRQHSAICELSKL